MGQRSRKAVPETQWHSPPSVRAGHGRVRADPGPGLDRRDRDPVDDGQAGQERLFERRRSSGLTQTRLATDLPRFRAFLRHSGPYLVASIRGKFQSVRTPIA